MPTVGWIHEKMVERDHEAAEKRRPPPKFPCVDCGREFPDPGTLRDHIRLHHPQAMPKLLFSGTVVAKQMVIRRPLVADGIEFVNCSSVQVHLDGRFVKVEHEDLPAWLSRRDTGHVHIVAQNYRSVDQGLARTEWLLELRLARQAELKECDRAFEEHLAVPNPTMRDVDQFLGMCPRSLGAIDYSGALADYVVGLLLKEQASPSGIRGDLKNFKDKLMNALEILQWHETRVARSVTAVCKFSLNAWKRIQVPPNLAELDAAVAFYLSLVESRHVEFSGHGIPGGIPTCYVDQATKWILQAAMDLRQERAENAALEELRLLRQNDGLTEYDLVKVDVLLAVIESRMGRQEVAKNHLQRLQFDEHFGAWARKELHG